MKKSWNQFFRRVATTCMIGIASAGGWHSAVCYAAGAFDSASDPVYADGWQAGDNGGTGFTAWNFDGTYNTAVQQTIDSSSPFNDLGTSWTLFNPDGPNVGADNPPSGGTDIARAGRGFNLGVGATLSVLVDNPTERRFFRGYFIRFNDRNGASAGNLCYAGNGCTDGFPIQKINVGTFEYFTNGNWNVTDENVGTNTTLFDTDTAGAGMEVRLTRTGNLTYDLVMDPLGAAASYQQSITLDDGVIDWIEFTHFNSDSDFNPTEIVVAVPGNTDFYISSMSIVPEPAAAPFLAAAGAALVMSRKRREAD